MIGGSITESNIRRLIPELVQKRQLLLLSNQHTRPGNEPGSPLGLGVDLNLGAQNLIGSQIVLDKGLHHDNRIGGDNHLPPGALIEDLPTLTADVGGVEAGEDGACGELDVAGLETGERDENHRLNCEGFGDE
uniref:Uncharacterized protein n=1 Tax=Opuntia streptacantha TaxID=393608 RepID=A0A7C8Z7R3_OPUST